jgi:hypothetical protein
MSRRFQHRSSAIIFFFPSSRSTHSVGSVSVEVMRDRSSVVGEQHQTGVLRFGDLRNVPQSHIVFRQRLVCSARIEMRRGA